MQPVAFTEDQLNTLVSAITSRVMAAPVAQQAYLGGHDLLALHPHMQVNQFVLFQLFTEWNAYMQRVRHPHFDFDHPDVAQTMEQLRVQLSHHIRLPQQELRPMLTKAIYNSLRLLLTPWDTIVKFFFADKDTLKLEDLQRYAGFFTDFDFIVQSLVTAYVQKGGEEITRPPFLEKLDKAAKLYDARSGESLDAYREAQFVALTGQHLSSWMEATQPTPKQGINTLPSAQQAPVPVVEPTVVPPTPARVADKFQPAKANPSTPTVPKPAAAAAFPGGILTLDSIPLHKQFQYIQKVFGGDAQRMKDTLAALNQLENAQAVADYLRTRIFNMPDNTHDAKINQEFQDFAQQRFG